LVISSRSLHVGHETGGTEIRVHAHLGLLVTILAVLLLVATPLASATSPGPVVPVGPSNGAEVERPEPACIHPHATTGLIALGTRVSGLLTAYPGPVVPVRPQPSTAGSTCQTDLSLSLKVKSRKDQEPTGADAEVDGLLVPRRTMESGFSTQLPADDRTITLTPPGDEWKVTEVSCSCGGGTPGTAAVTPSVASRSPLAQLTGYPGPVIPVGAGAASGGSTDCGGASAAAAGTVFTAVPLRHSITTYPGPVIQVGTAT